MLDKKIDDVVGATDALIACTEKKIALLKELKYILLIAKLIGRAPQTITEKVRVYPVWGSGFRPWVGASLHVIVGNEPEQVFPILDVPSELWPAEMRASYEVHKRRTQRVRP